jgi:acyl carrier protein
MRSSVTRGVSLALVAWLTRCFGRGMSNDSVSLEERILSILREECREPDRAIDRDDQLYEMLDSLGKVEVVMAVEDEFEIAVPEADAEGIKTVGELIDYISRHARARTVAAAGAGERGEPDRPADGD